MREQKRQKSAGAALPLLNMSIAPHSAWLACRLRAGIASSEHRTPDQAPSADIDLISYYDLPASFRLILQSHLNYEAFCD
jgi:hypothetical protein